MEWTLEGRGGGRALPLSRASRVARGERSGHNVQWAMMARFLVGGRTLAGTKQTGSLRLRPIAVGHGTDCQFQ